MKKLIRSTGILLARTFVMVLALLLTFAVFLMVPILQAISAAAPPDLSLIDVSTVNLPPPPPPIEEEEEEPEPEPEPEPPPQLEADEAPPLDLAQLELALNPNIRGEWLGADMSFNLRKAAAADGLRESVLSMGELDQEPRLVSPSQPRIDQKMRKRFPGKVWIMFEVNTKGRVEGAVVWKSSDPIFERSALDAVKKWRFEPGKKNGEPVRFRMKVPISFE